MTDGALVDLLVVECGQGLAGAFAAKALADFGADVIKVEAPDGDGSRRAGPFPGDIPHPERSGQFLYLNANKRGVTLDLNGSHGRQALRRLLERADILVSDFSPAQLDERGLDYRALAIQSPRLIVTAISPFGQTGPYRDYKGGDLIAWHMGGTGHGTPFNGVTRVGEQPPLRGGGYQTEYLAGWTAASATMAAVFYREAYGVGQLVDISAMEAVANMMRPSIAMHSYDPTALRESRSKAGSPWIYPCKDGHVSTSHLREHWWEALKDLMGRPEWAEAAAFADPLVRRANADALDALLSDWFSRYTREALYRILQARGIPCFPVLSVAETVTSPQYQARGYLVQQEHPAAGTVTQPGPSVRYSATPWQLRRPAPLLGQHNDEVRYGVGAASRSTGQVDEVRGEKVAKRDRPLQGIRVVDFGWILSVPHCTAWLATLGAEVIRVESTARLDLTRSGLGGGADGIHGPNRSGIFNGLNYGKKSVTLNLATERGRELARDLIRRSDIVCENFATGVLDRLGLGYEALCAVKPDLIMLTGSTLGTTGPERESSGWGPNVGAYAGLPQMSGYADGPPADLGGTWPDYGIGTMMVFALLTAVYHHRRTGEGQRVEVAMGEVVTAMIPEAVLDWTMNGRVPTRRGNRDPLIAPHDVFPCVGEDRWVAITVATDDEWRALCRAMDRSDLAADERFASVNGRLNHEDELGAQIAAWTQTRTRYEVMHTLQAAGVAAGPVLSTFDLIADPHLQGRGFLVEMDHPEVGKRTVAGLPAQFSAMPKPAYTPAPCLGQHNQEIFCGLMGLSTEDLRRLQAEQIIC